MGTRGGHGVTGPTSSAGGAVPFRPIGVVRSPFRAVEGMPIQASGARGIRGELEILPEYREGLADLDGFSHILVLYHFHRSRGFELTVRPFLDDRPHGVFATRAPCRPNPIGLSVVRLRSVEGCLLRIEDVDVLDGTPVLDIKPYVPEFDARTDVRTGWLAGSASRAADARADGRFVDPTG